MMSRADMIALLREADPVYRAETAEEAEEFLAVLSDTDRWLEAVDVGSMNLSWTGDHLELDSGSDTIEVSPYAMHSLRKRAENQSEILRKMKPEDQAAMLNMSWPVLKGKKANALVRGDRLMALHSERYVPLTQDVAFMNFIECMKSEFSGAELMSFTYRHSFSEMVLKLAESGDADMDRFLDAAVKCGYSREGMKGVSIGAVLQTSDLGNSSAKIYPILINSRRHYPVGADISITHRDTNSLDDVEEAFRVAAATARQSVDSLAELMDIGIAHPRSCAVNIAKHLDIPTKSISDIIAQMDAVASMPTSAYDVWSDLCEVMFTSDWENLSPERKLTIRGKLVRAVRIRDWSGYDRL